MWKYLLIFIGTISLLYGITVVIFYLSQDNTLFQPQSITEHEASIISKQNENIHELTMEVDHNKFIHGWISRAQQSNAISPLLIYFGGNAEEVSHTMQQFDHLEDWNLLFMNYRGYGLSDGSPSEANLNHDATVIFDMIANHPYIDAEKIVVMGRSMGTAPATHLSKEREVLGTILVSPYDSRTRLSEHRHPFMPVQTLIRHPFEISNKATVISSPLLALTASEDSVIPPSHSIVTANSWKGQSSKILLEGYGHNNLHQSEEYWKSIEVFLNKVSD